MMDTDLVTELERHREEVEPEWDDSGWRSRAIGKCSYCQMTWPCPPARAAAELRKAAESNHQLEEYADRVTDEIACALFDMERISKALGLPDDLHIGRDKTPWADAVIASTAALRQDRERLDWLEQHLQSGGSVGVTISGNWWTGRAVGVTISGNWWTGCLDGQMRGNYIQDALSLRAAIDAALSSPAGREGAER